MSIENYYSYQIENFNKLSDEEKKKKIERLSRNVKEYIEEIVNQQKDIFKTDLEQLDIEQLLKVENESLYLSVTINQIWHLIQAKEYAKTLELRKHEIKRKV
jgi:lipase chaperone LimK